MTYTIVASGSPTSFNATGLPAGLAVNTVSGKITGTPTTAGTSAVTISATNATGTGTAPLTITVAAANVAPVITSPTSTSGTVGTPFVTYLIAATGLPTSYTATGLPPGLALDTLTGAINGRPTSAGVSVVTLTATNSSGVTSASLTITITAAPVAPVITSPTTAPGTAGTPFDTYVIGGSGLPTSYTATGLPPGLSVNQTTGEITGTPTGPGTWFVTITATNAQGTSSAGLTITIGASAYSRIVNFSARAVSGPGDQTLIVGFVISGDGKNLLIRGIGPTLTTLGIANALADPMLTLFGRTGAVATNDDWQITSAGQATGTQIAATGAQVGAFSLASGSKDSALLFTVNNGVHTTSMVRPNSTTGVALTEVYDIDTAIGARLVNVSARMNVTAGEGTLIAGLVIAGNTPKKVLIRGVGPTLASFSVAGVLPDPKITVFSRGIEIASNDNWETGTSSAANIMAAAVQVGAFALQAGSKDASLLITLEPGAYTVHVNGAGTTTGVALIEVYDTE
jgi:PKD repeat protein